LFFTPFQLMTAVAQNVLPERLKLNAAPWPQGGGDRMLKRKSLMAILMALVLVLGAGLALAGQAQNRPGYGPGNQLGPVHDILSGTPFTYTGDVVSLSEPGQGMVIATETENVTIYGLGPIRYWQSLDVARPAVGETVTVEGYTVDYNGVLRNIAMSMTIGGQTVQLRDPSTGLPLWSGRRGSD
jgi:hypothetical protein